MKKTELVLMKDVKCPAIPAIVLFICIGLVSCTKESLISESTENTKIQYFTLRQGDGNTAAVRSTIDDSAASTSSTNWKVDWAVADAIYYFTGKGTTPSVSTPHKVVIQNVSTDTTIPAEYKDGDDGIVFFSTGTSIGSGTMSSLNTLAIADAAPANQDGTFASTHISVAKAALLPSTSPAVVNLTPVQSYIRFKMGASTVFADKVATRIVVKSNAGTENISGNISINNASSYAVTASGVGRSITINKLSTGFNTSDNYYVAILPGTYSSGLVFELYHDELEAESTSPMATVVMPNSITLSKGKVIDIGEIQPHKTVVLKEAEIFPKYAAFTKDMQKKFWVKIVPSDWNGTVTWSTDVSGGAISAEKVGDTYTYITKTGEEDIDGYHYWVYTVKPKSGLTANTDYAQVKLTATLSKSNRDATAGKTVTCKIDVGNFIDLGMGAIGEADGYHCIWGRRNCAGTSTGGDLRMLKDSEDDCGRSYCWGAPTGTSVQALYGGGGNTAMRNGSLWKYGRDDNVPYLQRYVGEYTGYTHYSADTDKVDDIASLAEGTPRTGWIPTWRTPKASEIALFQDGVSFTIEQNNRFSNGNSWLIKSKKLWYDDMSVYIDVWSGSGPARAACIGIWSNQCVGGNLAGYVIFGQFSGTTVTLGCNLEDYFGANVRPVKYVNAN